MYFNLQLICSYQNLLNRKNQNPLSMKIYINSIKNLTELKAKKKKQNQ